MKHTKTALAFALVALPLSAHAQARPKYEFGVDASVDIYTQGESKAGGEVIDDGGTGFHVGAPLDVRVGILNTAALNFEPRFTFSLNHYNKATALDFNPDLNAIYQPGKRALLQRGLYFTGGVGFDISRISGSGFDAQSRIRPKINAGVGMRRSINQGAFRPEGFVSYTFADQPVPSVFDIGARLGLSFWK